jgi:hypothetical protein
VAEPTRARAPQTRNAVMRLHRERPVTADTPLAGPSPTGGLVGATSSHEIPLA